MRSGWRTCLSIALLCMILLLTMSGICGADEKRLMIVVTGDTQGEIAPCG
jgi:hypothetical protein